MNENLVNKYGGIVFISTAIHHFYTKVMQSPILNPYFKDSNLDKVIRIQVNVFNYIMGGTIGFDLESIQNTHKKMNITQEAYDEWLRLLKLSFLELKIEPKDVEKILRRIEIIKTKLLF